MADMSKKFQSNPWRCTSFCVCFATDRYPVQDTPGKMSFVMGAACPHAAQSQHLQQVHKSRVHILSLIQMNQFSRAGGLKLCFVFLSKPKVIGM